MSLSLHTLKARAKANKPGRNDLTLEDLEAFSALLENDLESRQEELKQRHPYGPTAVTNALAIMKVTKRLRRVRALIKKHNQTKGKQHGT